MTVGPLSRRLLAEIRDVASSRGSRRSPLYQWLWTHHDAFLAAVSGRMPDWSALGEAFGRHGVHDGSGKAPSGRTLSQTWRRVRERRRAAGLPDVVGVVPGPASRGSGSSGPAASGGGVLPAPRVMVSGSSGASSDGGGGLPLSGLEALAAVQAEMARRSR